MKTIIVATDYSRVAENAVQYAAAVAEEHQAKLIVFNSFTLPVHASNSIFQLRLFSKCWIQIQTILRNDAKAFQKIITLP